MSLLSNKQKVMNLKKGHKLNDAPFPGFEPEEPQVPMSEAVFTLALI